MIGHKDREAKAHDGRAGGAGVLHSGAGGGGMGVHQQQQQNRNDNRTRPDRLYSILRPIEPASHHHLVLIIDRPDALHASPRPLFLTSGAPRLPPVPANHHHPALRVARELSDLTRRRLLTPRRGGTS